MLDCLTSGSKNKVELSGKFQVPQKATGVGRVIFADLEDSLREQALGRRQEAHILLGYRTPALWAGNLCTEDFIKLWDHSDYFHMSP